MYRLFRENRGRVFIGILIKIYIFFCTNNFLYPICVTFKNEQEIFIGDRNNISLCDIKTRAVLCSNTLGRLDTEVGDVGIIDSLTWDPARDLLFVTTRCGMIEGFYNKMFKCSGDLRKLFYVNLYSYGHVFIFPKMGKIARLRHYEAFARDPSCDMQVYCDCCNLVIQDLAVEESEDQNVFSMFCNDWTSGVDVVDTPDNGMFFIFNSHGTRATVYRKMGERFVDYQIGTCDDYFTERVKNITCSHNTPYAIVDMSRWGSLHAYGDHVFGLFNFSSLRFERFFIYVQDDIYGLNHNSLHSFSYCEGDNLGVSQIVKLPIRDDLTHKISVKSVQFSAQGNRVLVILEEYFDPWVRIPADKPNLYFLIYDVLAGRFLDCVRPCSSLNAAEVILSPEGNSLVVVAQNGEWITYRID